MPLGRKKWVVGIGMAVLLTGLYVLYFLRGGIENPLAAHNETKQLTAEAGLSLVSSNDSLDATTNLLIIVADRLSFECFNTRCYATCQVVDVLRGVCKTNQVMIGFLKNTCDNSIPKRAIWVLAYSAGDDRVSQGQYHAIGDDANKGVLPDSPKSRAFVKMASIDDLAPVPKSRWISREQATAILDGYVVTTHPRLTNATWHAVHMGYQGWFITGEGYKDGSPWPMHGSPLFIVWDDGSIKAEIAP